MSHVVVEWMRPHPRAPGATNGADVIWLDPRMNQMERRCVLTHELVHLELEHRGCQPPAVEREVRTEAARRLVQMQHLVPAAQWALSLEELADELWVTPMVLRDRLSGLTDGERQELAEAAGWVVPDGDRLGDSGPFTAP